MSQNTTGVPGAAEVSDRFGSAIAAGDVNGDDRADVLVGVPHEDVGTIRAAGAATLLYGSSSGLTGTGAQYIDQNSPGVPGSPERDDWFGTSVSLIHLNTAVVRGALISAPGEQVTGDPESSSSGTVTSFFGGHRGLTAHEVLSGRDAASDKIRVTFFGRQLAITR
jgi:hypothetical protein